MADADLFMECEEEELEPWQKMNDDVEDEEVSAVESKATSVPDSVTVGTTSLATIPSTASSGTLSVSMATASPTVQIHSNSTCSVSSVLPPAVGQPTVPSLVTQGLPKPAPGQQLILTQSPGGLGAVAMSHVLQPMQVMQGPAPGSSSATNQPIYFTTQGFPVQNVRPVQNPVNPLGIVLNVQPGQTVPPITLLSGTQFFKPAVGVPQVVSQPGPIRPGTPIAGRPASTTYTTVQIPATLTIRSNTPLSHPGAPGLATVVTSTATQPVHCSALPQNSQSKTVTPCGVAAVRHGDGTEAQRPPNAAPAVSAPAGTLLQAPPGILAKMASDGQIAAAASAVSSTSPYNNMRDMPLSAAEKQRRYRARRDANPDRREENLAKDRERWRRNKELERSILEAVNARTAAYNTGLITPQMSAYKTASHGVQRTLQKAERRYQSLHGVALPPGRHGLNVARIAHNHGL